MKRKSTACRIVLALFLAAIVMFLPVTVWAQETTLTTVVPSSHILHLELTGEGTIVVDGVAYTQSADIQIQRKSRPEISLQIADGNKVKSVLWGSKDITEAIKKGSWTRPEVTEDVAMTVTFEKTSSTPQTGDASRPDLWFIIAALSLIGIIICWLMRKKQKV
jgi:hypothetical protein